MRHNLQFDQFSTRHIRLWVCWTRSHLSYSVWEGGGRGMVFSLFLLLQSGAGAGGLRPLDPERSLLQGLLSS